MLGDEVREAEDYLLLEGTPTLEHISPVPDLIDSKGISP